METSLAGDERGEGSRCHSIDTLNESKTLRE